MLVVNFSGGRTSAYMCHKLISERPDLEMCFVFANTGKEREETLQFVHQCDNHFNLNLTWLEAEIVDGKGNGTTYKIVDFETASRKGEPFKAMIEKYGLPNKDYPHCTRELKLRPITKFANEIIGDNWQHAIGIRADEPARQKPDPKKVYPLVEWWPTWEIMVRSFWAGMPFDLELKDYEGNCDLCWKKSLRKRLTIIKENPGIERQWGEWEAASEYVFDRDEIKISELLEMSKNPFSAVQDKFELSKLAPTLFEIECELNFDRESSCFCS